MRPLYANTIKAFVFVFTVYVLFGIFLIITQKSILYYPDNQDFFDCPGFSDYEKIVHNNTRMYYLHRSNESVLVYYHGNAESACARANTRPTLEHNFNHSMIYVEYAGYSDDTRRPSQEKILQDIQNTQDFTQNYTNILVYGQSLGAAAASYHAGQGGVSALMLVTPFDSLVHLAQDRYWFYPIRFMLQEHYDNIEWLQDFEGSVIILHGSDDWIIPPTYSKNLYDSLQTTNKEYFLIESYEHNNIWFSQEFRSELRTFLEEHS